MQPPRPPDAHHAGCLAHPHLTWPRREEGVVEARSVDAALQALTVGDPPTDRHPEK